MSRRPARSLRDVVSELGDRATPAALPRGYGPAVIDAAVAAGEVRYRPDGVLEPVPRMGRPPRAGAAATVEATLRVTPAEAEELRAAAGRDGTTHWVRWTADRALEAARKRVSGR